MSDFEFFGTLAAFVAGFVLLVYLFRIRTKLIRSVVIRLRMVQERAMAHYGDKLEPEDMTLDFDETINFLEADYKTDLDNWGGETYRRERELR